MKLILSQQQVFDTSVGEPDRRHGTMHNGIMFMTTRALVGSDGKPLTGDYEDDFIVAGSRMLRLADGNHHQVFSIEIVNKAIHRLVDHEPWQRTNESSHNDFTAIFDNVGVINSGPKSRVLRPTGRPSAAWLGYNRKRGHYLAGMEFTDDLFLRRPSAGESAP